MLTPRPPSVTTRIDPPRAQSASASLIRADSLLYGKGLLRSLRATACALSVEAVGSRAGASAACDQRALSPSSARAGDGWRRRAARAPAAEACCGERRTPLSRPRARGLGTRASRRSAHQSRAFQVGAGQLLSAGGGVPTSLLTMFHDRFGPYQLLFGSYALPFRDGRNLSGLSSQPCRRQSPHFRGTHVAVRFGAARHHDVLQAQARAQEDG
jgi:hypothetical protein